MDLLIETYGTRIGKSGERIVLRHPNRTKKEEYPARRIKKILILRACSITAGAVELAIEYDIDVVFLGSFGKPIGRIFPSNPKGLAELRRAQVVISTSDRAFEIAKELVRVKSKNQILYLKHLQEFHKCDFSHAIIETETFLKTINLIPENLKGRNQLLGVEGLIAERYFSTLKRLHNFPGRKPRGRDKFNSALNYGYGILYNEVERACLYVGLDPHLGLYHAERYGKQALIFDLVEEFRVPIIDSTIFPLFLNNSLGEDENFILIEHDQYQLSTKGKRKIVEAVYTRLNQKVYWDGGLREVKKIIEHQIRSLAHNFLGKKDKYTPFSYSAIKNSAR